MISTPIQEFNSTFEAELSPELGSVAVWESPHLTTMFPAQDSEKGSPREVCHTVNGILRVRLISSVGSGVITAGLWGEYAGISGSIQTDKYPIPTFSTKFYDENSQINFDLFSNRANLCQNIYIRFTLTREIIEIIPVQPRIYIKATLSGVLLGGDIRY